MATQTRKRLPLDLYAVEMAGDLFEALDEGDGVKVARLLPEAHICRGQLLARLTGCTAEARPFLQGSLGHLERAIKAAQPPVPPPTPASLPPVATLPIAADVPEPPKVVPCPFCGQPKERQVGGEYPCVHCRDWLAGLRGKQKCKALTLTVQAEDVAPTPRWPCLTWRWCTWQEPGPAR